MQYVDQIRQLIYKDLLLEWRQKYALNGLILYIASTVFVIYISFIQMDPLTWNTIFWIMMLFISVNTVAKSFVQENQKRQLYYYFISSSQTVLISKMLYNTLLLLLMGIISYLVYSLILNNPVQEPALFFGILTLGCLGFSLAFTMVAAIASKASNNTTLMAILGFPVIIPILSIIIKLSNYAVSGNIKDDLLNDLLILTALDVIIVVVSLFLFPYLWRD